MSNTNFTLTEAADYLETLGLLSGPRPTIELTLRGFSPLNNTLEQTITWVKSASTALGEIKAAAVVCPEDYAIESSQPLLKVTNPKVAFSKLLERFGAPPLKSGIEPTAQIGKNVKLGRDVYIGHFVVINDNVSIGDRAQISSHVVIESNVTIGNDFSVRSHTVIGQKGFGFDFDSAGRPVAMPHIGSVKIGDNVEIGAFTTIVQGTLGNTIIRDHAKIDDHVHIAHNVEVGENSLVIACAEVSGSVKLGKNTWVGPNASIINGVTVGDRSLLGIGSVTTKDVPPNKVMVGVPAKAVRDRFED